MPPPQPYGPNTAQVRRFLQRLAARPVDDWVAAARHYLAAENAPRLTRADRALAAAIEASGRETARDAVVGPVVQLAEDAAARALERPAVESHIDPEAYAEVALAATLAVVVRDVLEAESFAALYAAFEDAVPVGELR